MLAYTHKARLFGEWLERTVGHYGYLIGTRGQTITPALIQRAWNVFDTYRNTIEEYANQWLAGNPDKGVTQEEKDAWKVTDCEGLEECFRMGGDIGNPLSDSELVNPDINSGYAYRLAIDNNLKHGLIATLPKDCPYPIAIGYPGHVMFYYRGKVYQAVGHRRGTIVEDYSNYTNKSKTQYWYQMPYYDYEDYLPFKQEGELDMIICKRGDTNSENARAVQTCLLKLYGKMTGSDGTVYTAPTTTYGSATSAGVATFQKESGLPVNGDAYDDVCNQKMLVRICSLSTGITQEQLDAEKEKVTLLSDQVLDLDSQLDQAGKDYVKLAGEKNKLDGELKELAAHKRRDDAILAQH